MFHTDSSCGGCLWFLISLLLWVWLGERWKWTSTSWKNDWSRHRINTNSCLISMTHPLEKRCPGSLNLCFQKMGIYWFSFISELICCNTLLSCCQCSYSQSEALTTLLSFHLIALQWNGFLRPMYLTSMQSFQKTILSTITNVYSLHKSPSSSFLPSHLL
jgi:hypothetical protein